MRKLTAAHEIPPPLELECLKVLWGIGSANVTNVRDVLARGDRRLAYTTVMTVLERLVRRGCIERRKIGRSFVYSAVLTQDAVRKFAVQDLVETFFEGSIDALRIYLEADQVEEPAVAAAAAADSSRLETALL